MAEYYIAPSWDDSTGDGSQGNPWRNFVYAVDNSDTTDTIRVMQGTNTQTVWRTNEPIPLSNRKVKWVSWNPWDTILDFSTNPVDWIQSWWPESDGEISSIMFQNNTTIRPFIAVYQSPIKNCVFKEFICPADSSTTAARAWLINNCNCTISWCVFWNMRRNTTWVASGIFTIRWVGRTTTTKVENCVVYLDGNNPAGSLTMDYIIAVREDNWYTIWVELKNCIVQLEDGNSLLRDYSYTHIGMGYTTTQYSCARNVIYNDWEEWVITDDPLFVDADNGNFRLRPDSPCIWTGSL